MNPRPFLAAHWRHLAMLNFIADPALLQPFIPPRTRLDFHNGQTFLSIVGFRFLNTRILGLPIPFHTNFDEVNLRFYVRRETPAGPRRGVVFIREIVPRAAIATVARLCYGEPYVALRMRHQLQLAPPNVHVRYEWRRGDNWESIDLRANGEPRRIESNSHEQFIAEQFWGYSACGSSCREYQVEHPPWKIWPATDAKLSADVASLYGRRFLPILSVRPFSAFLADGSEVTVRYHLKVD